MFAIRQARKPLILRDILKSSVSPFVPFQKGVQFARDDWRSRLVNDENLDRYQALLAYLSDLGKEKGATSGQIALAWVLQRKPYIVPIPGMRSVERLTENAKAEEITLTANEMKKVDELSLIE